MPGWAAMIRDPADARPNRRRGAAGMQVLHARAVTWGPELFRATLRETDFGEVRDSRGRAYDVRREPNAIRNHRERAVREAGFQANLRGTATREDMFALILNNTAAMLHGPARAIGAASFPELSYGERFLTTQSVHATLRAIAAASATNKRYEQRRAARVARERGSRGRTRRT